MKKLLIVLALALSSSLFISCDEREDLKKEIAQLKSQRDNLIDRNSELQTIKNSRESEIDELSKEVTTLHIYKQGRTPKYILKLKLKQSHFSLSISKHLKDRMNAIEFEMPVDKEFYDSVGVGSEIVDSFRVGSLLLSGSLGDWEMTVEDKEVR
jgi:hypothetical protein